MNPKFTLCIAAIWLGLLSPLAQNKSKLPAPINEPESVEYAPSISADGQTLIFQSSKYGLFVNAAKKVPQINSDTKTTKIIDEFETSFFGIYEVKLHQSGQWLKPNEITNINTFDRENMAPVMGGPSISYDGNLLFYFANYTNDSYGREDIYYSTRERTGWSTPKNIGKSINTEGYEGFPSISPDGKKLYFAREIYGKIVEGRQAYKIMVAEKNRLGQWRQPYELPEPVNGFCEKAPRIMPDGKTLVFSSIRPGGRGDFDLYKSVLQPDGSWSKPENLEFINTRKSDVFVAMNPCADKLYYVSDGDIFTTDIPLALRPAKIATIQGFVIDSTTNAPVAAKIIVKNTDTDETLAVIDNNPSDGRYTVLLPYGSNYSLTVNLPEYITKTAKITEDKFIDCKVIPVDLPLKPIVITATAPLVVAAATPSTTTGVPSGTTPMPKTNALEELELVADTPKADKVQINAEGQRNIESNNITQYAIILRVIDKETSNVISNATVTLTNENGTKLDRPVEKNGFELVAKALPGEKLSLVVNAPSYLPFEANLPEFTQDRRVTVKLVQLPPSYLTITTYNFATGQILETSCELLYSKSGKKEKLETRQGKIKLPLTDNETITITASATGFENLTKTVDINIPSKESKQYEVDLKLASREYFVNLEALNIENGQVIPNVVFYIFNQKDELIKELTADATGKARYQLPNNEPIKIQLVAEGFNGAAQNLNNTLNENTVKFKVVPAKKQMYELKVYTIDRYTGKEENLSVKQPNQANQTSPFFIKGEENTVFDFTTFGQQYLNQNHKLVLADSLLQRVRANVYVEKDYYDIDLRTLDAATQQGIKKAKLSFIENETKATKENLNEDNYYTLKVSPKYTYTLQINEPDYEPLTLQIKGVDWLKSGEWERDILLKKLKKIIEKPVEPVVDNTNLVETKAFGTIEKGKAVVIKNVNFYQSSPELKEESVPELKKLLDVLVENPDLKVFLKGHTDNVGDFMANLDLSKQRSETVANYLIKNGIDKKRIRSTGRGGQEPIAPNDTEANKSKNRRVEFILE